MLDVCGNYDNTGGSNIFLPLRGTEDYVVVAGWPMMFTTFTVGVDMLETGESITRVYDAFAENVTLMDMKPVSGRNRLKSETD